MGGTLSAPSNQQQVQERIAAEPEKAWQVTNPVLFTRTAQRCAYDDANEYGFRLAQLQLINYAIMVMTDELWKPVDVANYKQMHVDSMSYRDAHGRTDSELGLGEAHNFQILTRDPLFLEKSQTETYFKQYEDYLKDNAGAKASELREGFKQHVTTFKNLRDAVIKEMAKECHMAESYVPIGNYIPRGPPPPEELAPAAAAGGGRKRRRTRKY